MEVNILGAFGYFFLLGLFAGMVFLCFIWGIWEYKKPKDPGPLFIDLERKIDNNLEVREHSQVLKEMERDQKPEYLESVDVLMQGAETIRVRGDVRIPKGEVVPYNLIVEGNLTSQDDVTFEGGLHIKGRAVIGARNRLEKSIVCEEELVLLEEVIVLDSIDCEGPVFIKRGVRVGVGAQGGGIASASTICLEKTEGPLKVYAKKGVRMVESIRQTIPKDLKPDN